MAAQSASQWGNYHVETLALPPLEYVRVDPKAFFSNERTFIQWMHISVTMGSISLTLATLADSADVRTAGVLLIAPSLCFLLYGLLNFYRRRGALERGSSDAMEDRLGPAVLSLFMVSVVSTNLALKLRRAWVYENPECGPDADDECDLDAGSLTMWTRAVEGSD